MTTRQKGWLLGILGAILATIIGSSVLGAGSLAWNAKVDAQEFQAYVEADRSWKTAHLSADSARWRAQVVRDSIAYELSLDILCAELVRPNDRKCGRR